MNDSNQNHQPLTPLTNVPISNTESGQRIVISQELLNQIIANHMMNTQVISTPIQASSTMNQSTNSSINTSSETTVNTIQSNTSNNVNSQSQMTSGRPRGRAAATATATATNTTTNTTTNTRTNTSSNTTTQNDQMEVDQPIATTIPFHIDWLDELNEKLKGLGESESDNLIREFLRTVLEKTGMENFAGCPSTLSAIFGAITSSNKNLRERNGNGYDDRKKRLSKNLRSSRYKDKLNRTLIVDPPAMNNTTSGSTLN